MLQDNLYATLDTALRTSSRPADYQDELVNTNLFHQVLRATLIVLRLQMGNFIPWPQLLKQQSLMETVLDYWPHGVKHF